MRITRSLIFVWLAVLPLCAKDSGPADEVLAKMDHAAPGFSGMTSALKRVRHVEVLNDNSEESGSMKLRKEKPSGVSVLIDFTKPDHRSIAFHGRKAEIFLPKMNTVQEYDLGKQSSLVDQFLVLGFGATGRELSASYSVKYAGEESVASQKTAHLTLVPKSKEAREQFQRIDLWMNESGAYPVQQKVLEPSGDYWLVTYTDVKLSPAPKPVELVLNLPKNVKREYPQRER